jgi:DNA modification methylase
LYDWSSKVNKPKEKQEEVRLSENEYSKGGTYMKLRHEEKVIEILENVKTIGATPKQMARKLNIELKDVEGIIEELKKKGEIVRVGRNLWILNKYKDFNKVPNFITPEYYKREFEKTYGFIFSNYPYGKEVTANENYNERIHRWFFCVQGFSATFVNDMLNRFKVKEGDVVLDPFAGSGTVLVSAKLRNVNSIGVELLPIFSFACKVKTSWDIDVKVLEDTTKQLIRNVSFAKDLKEDKKPFLKETERHFDESVLRTLLRLKEEVFEVPDKKIRRALQLALASILIPCSNLKRSPCLGYTRKPKTEIDVIGLFKRKIEQIVDDLNFVKQNKYGNRAFAEVITGDSRRIRYKEGSIKLAITSPPYVNGLDYVINYKIEMAWLELVDSYNELAKIKAEMVACDNIPRSAVARLKTKEHLYSDEWLERIVNQIEENVKRKVNYRRNDMHLIVRKYFEDLYPVFENVYEGLDEDGRFAIVIGDSLIAGVYVPTDLILARMGERVGFSIESVEVARKRRSGQRHDFILRESIIILKKGKVEHSKSNLLYYLK